MSTVLDSTLTPSQLQEIVKAEHAEMVDRIIEKVEEEITPQFSAAIIPLQDQLFPELSEKGHTLYGAIEHLSIANMLAFGRASFDAGFALATYLHRQQSKTDGSYS